MVDVFGATSTTEEVLSSVNLHGKRILVTGVSAGIGVELRGLLLRTALKFWARRGIWPRLKRQLHKC